MTVAALFDSAAGDYDRARRQLVPCFDDFYGTVLDLVPYEREATIRVLDLGAGTGLLSALVAEAFPRSRITLVDVSGKMLERARQRFSTEPERFHLRVMDYAKEPLPGKYEVVLSALSIHHLSEPEKRDLFGKIYESLFDGGAFINADQVLGATPEIEGRYQQWWLRRVREAGVSKVDLGAALERMKEDKNSTLEVQVAWLEEAGFEAVDCPYKNHRFAVYAGRKAGQKDAQAYHGGKDSTYG